MKHAKFPFIHGLKKAHINAWIVIFLSFTQGCQFESIFILILTFCFFSGHKRTEMSAKMLIYYGHVQWSVTKTFYAEIIICHLPFDIGVALKINHLAVDYLVIFFFRENVCNLLDEKKSR